MTVLYTSSTS